MHMQKAISWCLAGIIIGLLAYIVIDRVATPQPVSVGAGPGIDGTRQPGAVSGASTGTGASGTSAPVPAPAPSGQSRQGVTQEPGFRTDLFEDRATDNGSLTGQPLDRQAVRGGGQMGGMTDRTRERVNELRDIQAELRAMSGNPQGIDMQELDSVLLRLEQASDGGQGGVDLSTLRESLGNAARMMELGQRVNQAVSDGASAEEMAEYVEELERLQGELVGSPAVDVQ